MTPAPFRLYQLWHEITFRVLVAAPFALARPLLDLVSREEADD